MNDLEEPAIRLHHEINSAAEILKSEGVTHVTMSGSGSTVFGLVSSRDESERIAARLTERGLWAKAVYTIVR
jgi:4-diphosphocytidyl-2C-methyl-D-erythritol kinase